MKLIKIKKELVDECFKKGLVKPNEFRGIVDELVHKELFERYEEMKNKNLTFNFIYHVFNNNIIEKFYKDKSKEKDVVEQIADLAKREPETLLIDSLDSRTLFVAHTLHRKAKLVRDCGDMLESNISDGEDLLVDKETLLAVDYLLKYKNTVYDLLK